MQLNPSSKQHHRPKRRTPPPSSSTWLAKTIVLAASFINASAASPCTSGFIAPQYRPSRQLFHASRRIATINHRHRSSEFSRFAKYKEGVIDEPLLDSLVEDTTSTSCRPSLTPTSPPINTPINSITNERTLGILILLTVPLAWGTYTPVVKYMYERMDPAVPGFVFSAGYYLVAAATLSTLNTWSLRNVNDESREEGGATMGGLELGSYLFLGNGFQVVGLQTVPADRAAFLVQLTTVMVPLVSAWVSGRGLASVPLLTWVACVVAFIGVVVIGMDDNGQGMELLSSSHISWENIASSIQISQGDDLIILAALAYTMHVVRLGVYAPKTRPLNLAASKARTEAFFSVVLVIVLVLVGSAGSTLPEFIQQMGKEVVNYFDTLQTTIANTGSSIQTSAQTESSILTFVAAILWTGLITSAYTIYAQSYGQRRINPVDSNLIYTTQPLFSSLFAYGMLGEKLGVSGWIGAGLIGVALGLVAFGSDDE
jgi:drug/metabolite transporter (DMT)-like permease